MDEMGGMGEMNVERAERYPAAYIEYLVQFQAVRDYFECHEILEDYWKEHPNSRYRETWVMLIQLAVSLYHERRGNMRGAIKLMTGAIRRYEVEHMRELGVDGEALRDMMRERIVELTSARADTGRAFQDLNLPIIDPDLEARCKLAAEQRDSVWEQASNLEDVYLVNRHKLRDRQAERQERLAALKRAILEAPEQPSE